MRIFAASEQGPVWDRGNRGGANGAADPSEKIEKGRKVLRKKQLLLIKKYFVLKNVLN
jgi:hypothetical protein